MADQSAAEAKQQAIDARTQTGRAIIMARGNAMGVMAITSRLLAGVVPLADAARRQLERLKEDGTVDPKLVFNLVKATAYIVRETNASARMAQEMETVELGTVAGTEATTEVVPPRIENMDFDEALARLEAARVAIQRAKESESGVGEARDPATVPAIPGFFPPVPS